MSVKFQAWAKKPKTLLRHIRPGDIFCFSSGAQRYYFGRIMTRNRLGHVAEVFCDYLTLPDASQLPGFSRLGDPLILDSYSLFDRKIEGDWRIVGHQADYVAPTDEPFFFTYGVGPSRQRVDIFDREVTVTGEEAKAFPDYSPMGDFDVKEAFGID